MHNHRYCRVCKTAARAMKANKKKEGQAKRGTASCLASVAFSCVSASILHSKRPRSCASCELCRANSSDHKARSARTPDANDSAACCAPRAFANSYTRER